MKKTNLLLFCFILLIASCTTTPEVKKTTVLQYFSPFQSAPEFLNGQIKSVKEVTYSVVDNNGVIEKGELFTKEDREEIPWSLDFICYFNEDGLLTKSVRYNGTEEEYKNKLKYTNNLLSDAYYIYNDTVERSFKLKSDENGHLASVKGFDAIKDSLTWIGKFECNTDGFIIKQTNYNANKELQNVFILKRNEKNLTTEIERFNDSDSLTLKFVRAYNEKGFYILSEKFDGNNKLEYTLKMEYTAYDEMGNWTSKTAFENDTAITICERIYEYY